MKLWLLLPQLNYQDHPWSPCYDKAFGFVVRAEDEHHARLLASQRAGDEADWDGRYNPWLDENASSCIELTGEGEAAVILRDYCAA